MFLFRVRPIIVIHGFGLKSNFISKSNRSTNRFFGQIFAIRYSCQTLMIGHTLTLFRKVIGRLIGFNQLIGFAMFVKIR